MAVASGARPDSVRIRRRAWINVVDFDPHQPAALQRLEIGGQGRAVHRQQCRHITDARGVQGIKRHHQRKLTVGQIEQPKGLIETPRHRPRRALQVQAQAAAAKLRGFSDGQFFGA